MQRLRLTVLALIPALLLMGCGGGGGGDKGPVTSGPGPATGGAPSGEKTALDFKDTGTVKGRVVYDGTPPAPTDLTPQVDKNEQDRAHCKMDPTKDSFTGQAWVVGKDGGVANVAVWIRPPAGKYFKKPANVKDVVAIDQPFCAFEPHVAVLYSETWDEKTKKLVPTGQKIKFLNGAPMNHNTSWKGNEVKGIGGNVIIPSKGEQEKHLASDYSTVVNVNCDFHKWMSAYVWSLETPYAAVTDKDGNFEIKDVPAGSEVLIVPWHEQAGFFGAGGNQGEKITVKAGETLQMKEYKVKAK